MSTVEAKVVAVDILPHNNADKLELAQIGGAGGWICVVAKGLYKSGDLTLYVPEDSIIPENIQEHLAKTSKIAIHGGRIRPTRIRGVLSQGLCLAPKDWLPDKLIFDGSDVTEYLGVKKYEAPPPRLAIFAVKGDVRASKKFTNENFKKYSGIERFQKNPKTFAPTDNVEVTVKYHGTNFRAGIVKKAKMTLWDRVLKLFGKYQDTQFLVGSHETIRLQDKKKMYKQDLYWKAALKYDIEGVCKHIIANTYRVNDAGEKVHPKEVVVYGEIIGPGIQKGYDYGIPEGEIELRVFDIMEDGKFIEPKGVQVWCADRKLPHVEVLYEGPWKLDLLQLAEAVDEYGGKKYVREGVVIKSCAPPRNVLKHLNSAYLLDKTNSEYH